MPRLCIEVDHGLPDCPVSRRRGGSMARADDAPDGHAGLYLRERHDCVCRNTRCISRSDCTNGKQDWLLIASKKQSDRTFRDQQVQASCFSTSNSKQDRQNARQAAYHHRQARTEVLRAPHRDRQEAGPQARSTESPA